MADLTDLYQQIIVEHNRSPRNFKRVDDALYLAKGMGRNRLQLA